MRVEQTSVEVNDVVRPGLPALDEFQDARKRIVELVAGKCEGGGQPFVAHALPGPVHAD